MNIKKAYSGLSVFGDKIIADQSVAGDKLTQLSPGIYTPHYDHMNRIFWFEVFNPVSDTILELDSAEYKQVTKEMNYFLQNETKETFKQLGYIYKRSALLHGLPGTGKTCIVSRISRDVVSNGGIVLYCSQPDLVRLAFDVLDSIQPETTTMVVFEEFDEMAKHYERILLRLLDGEIQKQNVIYLATTNYLDRIPKRLYRPGRFASVIEVNFPSKNARKEYFIHKLGNNFEQLETFVERTHGFSIDELKEVIQSVIILKNDLDFTLNRIISTRDFQMENQKDNLNDTFSSISKLMDKFEQPKLVIPEGLKYNSVEVHDDYDDNEETSGEVF